IGALMDANGQDTVTNFGKIIGASYVGVYFTSAATTKVTLNNFGNIFGRYDGVINSSQVAGGTLNNAGTIRSNETAVSLSTDNSLTTSITNTATGIIKGITSAILIIQGKLALTNHGTIVGAINDTAGVRDTIVNTGHIKGPLVLGGGNDVFNG